MRPSADRRPSRSPDAGRLLTRTWTFARRIPHAVAVATVAAGAADQVRAHGDGPHLGGLLHDIGRYVLPIAFGEQACDDIAAVAPDGPERVLLETERFSIDHALAGALLAERWGVSAEIVAAIAWHHGGPTGVASP